MNEGPGMTPARWAEIIAVGSELLAPPRVDTNSIFLCGRLNDLGIEVRAKSVVGDRLPDVAALLRAALARTPLVILTGGLGPTRDDLTREAVAEVLGRPMAEDAGVLERIRRRFAERGVPMPDVNRQQALAPEGAIVVPNAHGTAPGLWIEHDGKLIILLPGPPGELQPMFEGLVRDRLLALQAGAHVYRREIRICGRTESDVEQTVLPIYAPWVDEPLPIEITVLTAPGQIELHCRVRSDNAAEANARLSEAVRQLTAALAPDVFSDDGRTLEQVVGQALRERHWRIAVAESCTGGLVSARLTDVAGASDYVEANAVCYSNEAKSDWLGVPRALLSSEGAVSEPVAEAMAEGIRRRVAAEVGVAITGIAGPAGGTAGKPVGTVVIAAVTPDARAVRTYRFPGGRDRVRAFAAQTALDLVRRLLSGFGPGGGFVAPGVRERRP